MENRNLLMDIIGNTSETHNKRLLLTRKVMRSR